MKIYVAGPYSADNVIDILGNIRRGIDLSARLLAAGYSIFCPFLDFQFALTIYGGALTKADYQRNSMAWVDVSDAVLVSLPGWEKSRGTEREIERATSLRIPVFYSVTDLENYRRSKA